MTKTAYDEVKDVMDTYFRSVRSLDFKLMRSVTHKDGRIFLGNESTSKNLHDHWSDEEGELIDEERKKMIKKMRLELLSIEAEGTIANVKLRMGNWLDFHNLVKTPKGWKIITKVSHRIE